MCNYEYDILNLPTINNEIKEIIESVSNNKIGICNKSINQNTSSIIEYIKKHGISNTVFFISIYMDIYKYGNQDIVYISIISANRYNHYIENMVGMFVSTQSILLKYENENSLFD